MSRKVAEKDFETNPGSIRNVERSRLSWGRCRK
jgi:hypothetical protein